MTKAMLRVMLRLSCLQSPSMGLADRSKPGHSCGGRSQLHSLGCRGLAAPVTQEEHQWVPVGGTPCHAQGPELDLRVRGASSVAEEP